MSRFGNRSSASSVLQRAQNQLHGKRVAVSGGKKKDEDDIGAYLSTLSLKTSAQKSQKENIDISDVSLSSQEVKPTFSAEASRFLKKKKTASDTDLQRMSKSVTLSSSQKKPSSQSNLHVSKSVTNFSSSSALNKFAAFEKRFDQKSDTKGHRKPEKDPSLSDDDFGKSGSRFLKKKPQSAPVSKQPHSSEREKHGTFTSTPKQSYQRAPLNKAASFNIGVSDSDEEFMRNLTPVSSPEIPPIRDVSELEPAKPAAKSKGKSGKKSKRQSPTRSGRTPSPILKRRTPSPPLTLRRLRHDSIGSESIASVVDEVEMKIDASVHDSTVSEETFAGVHVLGIDQLQATTPEPEVRFDPTPRMISPDERSDTDTSDRIMSSRMRPKRQSSRDRPAKRQFGVFGAEDLRSIDQASEIESEILTQRSVSEIKTQSSVATPRSARLGRSFSGYSEDTYTQDFESGSELSDTVGNDRSASPRGRRSPESRRAAWRNKRHSTYSDDFESFHQTESDVTIDLPEDDSESPSYSESFTSYTESRTITRSPTPQKRRAKKKDHATKDVAIQVDDALSYNWKKDMGTAVLGPSLGLQYVDPNPIASHVISPDAVEALTTYSPSVLALNDMLRSQIQITQQFIQNSRRIYQSYTEAVSSSYQYVTLEDTKEYLQRHRKPRLTFEQALRQVREEMGMEAK